MDCSTSGFPVYHQLPKLSQTNVHQVGDAIQPLHPLLSLSPSALNLSQHQGLFEWVSFFFYVRWPKYWSFSFSISPSKEYSGLISFRIDWLNLLAVTRHGLIGSKKRSVDGAKQKMKSIGAALAPGLLVWMTFSGHLQKARQSGRRVFPITFSSAAFSATLSLSTAFSPSFLLCSPILIMINNKSLTHFYKALISLLPCDGGLV